LKQLAYGTHLIFDGFGVEAELAGDAARVNGFLDSLAEFWPLGASRRSVYELPDGLSAVQAGRYGHAVLHFFSEGWLVVDMFTAQDADPTAAAAIIERAFEPSRFDLRITRRSHALPKDAAELERAVLGERHYARARLTPLE